MRRINSIGAVLAFLSFFTAANGDIWIGGASTSGPVVRPSQYDQAVVQFSRTNFNFDQYSQGVRLESVDTGGLELLPETAGVNAYVDHSNAASAIPSSLPAALHFEKVDKKTTILSFVFSSNEEFHSLGFVLMGLTPTARLKVYDGQNELGDYSIPSTIAGGRRWVGVVESYGNISEIRLEPTSSSCYSIDDIEIGYSTPEPATLLLCSGAVFLMGIRRRGGFGCRR